jgi:hypothetical protein
MHHNTKLRNYYFIFILFLDCLKIKEVTRNIINMKCLNASDLNKEKSQERKV